jgi:signal transduction histidine kinase
MIPGSIIDWFAGDGRYMRLKGCMGNDYLWIWITVALDFAVAAGYVLIARHWWVNARQLPPSPAKRALSQMRNIFVFCGICGYIFIPIKMVWPAWRLYDLFMLALVYFTWRYAWNAANLKVIYAELGRNAKLVRELADSREESKRKTFFLNAISHDLRTPINAMVLQAQLAELGAKTLDEATLREAVIELKTAARSASDLLDTFLECARIDWADESTRREAMDLGASLNAAVNSFRAVADEKGIDLRADFSAAGLHVHSDRVKVERIVSNLISNAIKFTSHGSVSVQVEPTPNSVKVHVIDTGIGIDPLNQDRVFDEFFQVHNRERDRTNGFGLGLSIARRLARQLGGDVVVESSHGKGSRFTLLLPVAAVAAASANGNGVHTPAPAAVAAS